MLYILTQLKLSCFSLSIGGAIPIIYPYLSELVPQSCRGRHMSWLNLCWASGAIFPALMAWAIFPEKGKLTFVLKFICGNFVLFKKLFYKKVYFVEAIFF